MATMLGMDKNATEAVDAEVFTVICTASFGISFNLFIHMRGYFQTCNTIDPARQAIDALQSRSVRIVPVVTFAVEILPPNFSFKNPASTPTK